MAEAKRRKENFQTIEQTLQSTVKKYAREAIWLKSQDEFKNTS